MPSITYPLALPAQFKSAEIQLVANAVVAMTESPYTLSEQVQVGQGMRIEGVITLPRMKREIAEYVVAFLLKLNAGEGTFYGGDTANKLPRGTAAGAPKTNGIATARSWDLVTDGWTVGATLLAGDWIQVGTGSTRRLHKVLNDAVADGGGAMTLQVWPRVRTAYADNTDIVTNTPTGVFRLREPGSWNISLEKVYSITVPIAESIF